MTVVETGDQRREESRHVIVDPDLLQYDEVWAAAGTWNDNFGSTPAAIVRVDGGAVIDLKYAS